MRFLGKVFIALGLLLLSAAFALIIFNQMESDTVGITSQEILDTIKAQAQEDPLPTVPAVPEFLMDPDREMPVMESEGEEYIGILEIPALELELPVMSQWSYTRLQKAPCRWQGTAYRNDLIIMAHNYKSHFGRLVNLSPGDLVFFVDVEGSQFVYSILEIVTLENSASEMVSGDWDLTLFTCTRGGRFRVAVRCERLE